MAVPLPSTAKLSVGTTVQTQNGVKWSTTIDGTMYGRDLYSQARFIISAKFNFMEEADAETLETFLQNNRTVPIELVLRQYTYHAYMVSEVNREYNGGEGVVTLSATFNGVRV